MLRAAQIRSNEVEQQVGEVRSAVLAAGMVESANALLQLDDDLRRGLLLSDHASEVTAVAAAHEAAAVDGECRLRVILTEMQAALRKLEENYYMCSVRSGEEEPGR